ncbi:MAG: peptidylprolyl isomerase [Actinomycetota bacterium]|nr:peptidylprolyl isomerase [Actinomycetota bacterium]
MVSRQREKELARARAERQAARRAERAAARKRRNIQIAAVAAVALVVGAMTSLAMQRADRNPADEPTAAASPGGCAYEDAEQAARKVPKPDPAKAREAANSTATVRTNRGDIVIELLAGQAPCTVNAIRHLAEQKYYDDTRCHRLVTSGIFVLQCGDPSGTGSGGPGFRFADEALEGAEYPAGTVAMANAGPDTNGSQFFVVYQQGGLEANYTPFGRVTRGLDLVEAIAAEGNAPDGTAPKRPVTIESFTVAPAA